MSTAIQLLLLLCLSFSHSPSLSLPEGNALLAFKKSLSNPSQILPSWNPNSEPCKAKWQGVFCGKGENGNPVVIRIHLQNMGLKGSINIDALSELKNLISFSISKNSFNGSLPSFNKLKRLKALYLDSNIFSEEIPEDFFDGMNLRRIWFSNNQFSGKIPKSLGKLLNLRILHLENNKFIGSIPDISQRSIKELDLSGNQLEGRIPENMERFGGNAFKDNIGVCGKSVRLECQDVQKNEQKEGEKEVPTDAIAQQSEELAKSPSHAKGIIALVVALTIIMLILLIVSIQSRPRSNDFDYDNNDIYNTHNFHGGANKNQMDTPVEIQVQGNIFGEGARSSKKTLDSSHKIGSQKGSICGKKEMGDLVMINNEKGVFGLTDLMKAAAEMLGNTGLGSAYKAIMSNGVAVVVKRIRGMTKLEKNEFDTEIRRLGKLHHKNILVPLAYHYRKEEKLLVYEHVSKGSLQYILHGDRGSSHSELDWPTRLKIIKGIAMGMKYLYKELPSYELSHGNLKSSNVLLDDNYEPVLCDYGFCKMFSPEKAAQGMFAYKAPEVFENQHVSSKCDVYCLGIIILEILTGKFPSQYHIAGKGGTDVVQWVWSSINEEKESSILDPEIASSTKSVDSIVRLLHLGALCCENDPNERPSLEEVFRTIKETKA